MYCLTLFTCVPVSRRVSGVSERVLFFGPKIYLTTRLVSRLVSLMLQRVYRVPSSNDKSGGVMVTGEGSYGFLSQDCGRVRNETQSLPFTVETHHPRKRCDEFGLPFSSSRGRR